MKSLVFSLVAAAAFGVVLSLPFNLHVSKKQALIPLARDLGATRFAHYVNEANLTANFTKRAGNFTLFVPINTAWKDLSKNVTGNRTLIRDLILFHSVNGTFKRNELKNGTKLKTLSGKFLFFNVTKDKSVFVNGVNITKYNQRASNGNIFLISEVIINGSGVQNKTNSTKPTKAPPVTVTDINKGKEALIPHVRSLGATKFAHYVHEANLTANFTKRGGNFTLFVPVNTAWESLTKNITGNKTLLRELILFHSVNGTYTRAELRQVKNLTTLSGKHLFFNFTKDKTVFVNGVNITKFNQRASNGNIFLLGEVILNGSGVLNHTNSTKPTRTPLVNNDKTREVKTEGSITHVLSKNWSHYSTLITDLMKSGVWSELENDHVTLLAPTNAAFQSLTDTYMHNLDNDVSFLKKTLKYHILQGVHASGTLHHNDFVTTVEGHRVHVTHHNGQVSHFNNVPINNVIHTSNGYIYVLSGVLHVPNHPIV